jgi:hypothetical protein
VCTSPEEEEEIRDLATGKDLSIPEDFSLTLLYPNFLLQHTRKGRMEGIRK